METSVNKGQFGLVFRLGAVLIGGVARQLRSERPGGRYPMMSCGTERMANSRGNGDRFHFLALLREFGEHTATQVPLSVSGIAGATGLALGLPSFDSAADLDQIGAPRHQ